jgi:hypothetical protein
MPPPNRPKNRPNRPKRNRPRRRPSGSRSGRRGGGSRRAAARREANRRSERNIDRARSGQTKRESRQATGGTSTPRERGIAAANTFKRNKKERDIEQSVGSLDRRVEKAIAEGNTALAKDLRSRQKKFVKDLAYERARKTPGGTIQGNIRTSDGKRPLTTAGFDVFQETMDQDFIDPTRKLQNIDPDAYSDMYPISAGLQGGLPTIRLAKKAFGVDDKPIPYNLQDMPGVRYPLQRTPVTTRSDRQDPLDEKPFTISDRQPGFKDFDETPLPLISLEFGRPLPDMAPFIDKETRNEVFAQDVDNLPANNFNALLEEFERESAELNKKKGGDPTVTDKLPMPSDFNAVTDKLPMPSDFNLFGQNDVDTIIPEELSPSNTEAFNTETANLQNVLMGSGYNLSPEVITNLYQQGFLNPNTNYFANSNTNPLVDEALASYYNTLQ